MLPIDLADERDRRERKAFRAVAVALRQARIHATPAEVIGLEVLADDCQARRTTAADAAADVARLRDIQHARREAA